MVDHSRTDPSFPAWLLGALDGIQEDPNDLASAKLPPIQGSAMHDLPVPGGEFIQVDLLHVLTPFDNFAA